MEKPGLASTKWINVLVEISRGNNDHEGGDLRCYYNCILIISDWTYNKTINHNKLYMNRMLAAVPSRT